MTRRRPLLTLALAILLAAVSFGLLVPATHTEGLRQSLAPYVPTSSDGIPRTLFLWRTDGKVR